MPSPGIRKRRSPMLEVPTIADVARLAGVSSATVSYVLNDRTTEVSSQTANRVRKAVRQLGYVKNLTASALSGKKSKMIAVIIPGVFNPHPPSGEQEINPVYGEFLFRLEHEARSRGYALCLYGGREEDYVHFLIQRYVEAAVLVGFSEWDLPGILERQDIHLVLYDSFEDDAQHSHVRTDEVRGGALSAEYLIESGRSRLAFAGGAPSLTSNNIPSTRYKGAKRVCDEAGVPLHIMEMWITYAAGVDAAKQVIEMGTDGVVTTADIIAAGLMEGLASEGVRVPEDVAVVGYDNLPMARLVRPRLTTIDQRLSEKVQAVMALISRWAPGHVHVVEPRLIVRESA